LIKLVRRHGGEELFDLIDDPLEERPLAVVGSVEARYGQQLGPLRQALAAAADEEKVATAAVRVDGVDPAEVAALEEQMRLLGYL
jgi:hypothetical protein